IENSVLSSLLLVLGVAILSLALRTFHNAVCQKLGALGILATSFLAGWRFTGFWPVGVACAASWLLLPWLEILTRVRRLRLPREKRHDMDDVELPVQLQPQARAAAQDQPRPRRPDVPPALRKPSQFLEKSRHHLRRAAPTRRGKNPGRNPERPARASLAQPRRG